MLNPNHPYFDRNYSRLNKAENRKDPLARPDDKFTFYNDLFAGCPIPKSRKKPYVANAIMREPKISKTERMQQEINALAN